jgi:hypothetical protein
MKLNAADRGKLRKLVSSAIAKNLVIERELFDEVSRVLSGDFAAMLKTAQSKDNFVKLHSAHDVVYDIMIESEVPMEHLSISRMCSPSPLNSVWATARHGRCSFQPCRR